MQIPISTEGMAFIVADAPRQRQSFETKELVFTEEGKPVFSVTVLMMDGTDSVPVRVRVDGDPGVMQGQQVRPVGLGLHMINRKGDAVQWWVAEAMEPIGPSPLE